jgi:hypothetical protein
MEKTKPKIQFRPTELKSGSGWYVQVVFFDAPPYQLGGFRTEEEAKEWIVRESAAWLRTYWDGRYA